jgi:TonB family protein
MPMMPTVSDLYAQTLNDLGVRVALLARDTHDIPLKTERLKEAEGLHQAALALREKVASVQVGQSLDNLVQLYSDWERWSDAAAAGERSALLFERQRGSDDREVIMRVDSLATIYLRAGRLADAGRIADRLQLHAAGLRTAGRVQDAAMFDARVAAIRSEIARNEAFGALRPGDTTPKLRKEVKPVYSERAKAERIQGEVFVELVVKTDGTVGDVRVVKPVDPDLDRAAVDAVKQWEFDPGSRGGKPVEVVVTVAVAFTLK